MQSYKVVFLSWWWGLGRALRLLVSFSKLSDLEPSFAAYQVVDDVRRPNSLLSLLLSNEIKPAGYSSKTSKGYSIIVEILTMWNVQHNVTCLRRSSTGNYPNLNQNLHIFGNLHFPVINHESFYVICTIVLGCFKCLSKSKSSILHILYFWLISYF